MTVLALAITLAMSSEVLIIISNFFLGLATLAVFWATLREQNQSLRAIIKSDNGIIKRLSALLTRRK